MTAFMMGLVGVGRHGAMSKAVLNALLGYEHNRLNEYHCPVIATQHK